MKKIVRFTKMHGAGNDYIYLNGFEWIPENPSDLSIKMSDRHKGVGSDGLVIIMPSEVADFRMRMFNADGSEGEMCGNASRCIARFVYEKGLTTKHTVTLETLNGIKVLNLNFAGEELIDVTVDMGEPTFDSERIPVKSERDVREFPIQTSEGEFLITAVSTGNPHGVIFTTGIADLNLAKIGPEIETNPIFPKKANIEFVEQVSANEVNMRVWERGSGETMACGTGACATVVVGATLGKCAHKTTVHLLGGDLKIDWHEDDNHVFMTGNAVTVFEGEYPYEG